MRYKSFIMRIVLILPCCIGDVVLATATLSALRRIEPNAHIAWAVGSWSRPAIEHHPHLNGILDTGAAALPVKSPREFIAFVRQLREGHFDVAVSLVRSPLMSAAVWASRIPIRAGIDSAGRGFGYTHKARIHPLNVRHEAEIYLDVVRAMGVDTDGCYANLPVTEADRRAVRQKMAAFLGMRLPSGRGSTGSLAPERYIVVNPAGGNNPGMSLDVKRYPPDMLAPLVERLSRIYQARLVLIGGPNDGEIVRAVRDRLSAPGSAVTFVGELTFGQIGALAADAVVYIGNDTGMTHLAAASGARTVMIMGPTDPARYAPYTPKSLALWKPAEISARGVAGGAPSNWDWEQDGISPGEAEAQIVKFLSRMGV